jgi:hypothetical protein
LNRKVLVCGSTAGARLKRQFFKTGDAEQVTATAAAFINFSAKEKFIRG